MAQITKQALRVENNTEFPNNNNGQIKPSNLRGFNEDMIDSLVDEIGYNVDSGSWNSSIASLTAFTSSVPSYDTGSLLTTASFDNGTRNLLFTKGDTSQFTVNIPDVSGSTIDTSSLATTGSNSFLGDQTITGSLSVSKTIKTQIYINPQTISGSIVIPTGNNAMVVGPISIDGTISVEGNSKLIVLDQVTGSAVNTSSLATTGSNIFNGDQTINGGLLVSSSTQPIGFSGSTFTVDTVGGIVFRPGTDMTFQGNTVFTNPGRFPILNVDSATQTNGYYGFNDEVDGRIYQAFSGSVDSRINGISGGVGLATTGSNIFIGNQTITGSLLLSSSVDRVVINAPNYSTFNPSDIGGIDLNSSVTFRSDVRFLGAIRTAGQISLGTIIGTSASTLPASGNQLNIITNLQIFDDSNINNPRYVSLSGSADVSQSLQVGTALKLKSNDPLPTGSIGDLAVSGSSLYFYNGAWTLVV